MYRTRRLKFRNKPVRQGGRKTKEGVTVMNTGFENMFAAASDKARELKELSAELLCSLTEGRHYVLNLCFAAKSNRNRRNFTKDSMTEFSAISVPSAAPAAQSVKNSFAERRRLRLLAEARRQKLCELKEHIEYTKSEMNAAMSNFNNVTEPKLIDYYIYKIQSEQNRYEQLLIEYKSIAAQKTGI